MDLTKRQKEIFDFIRRYASKYGYPPTVREIGKAVGLHFVLDRARPPREPREARGCCAATRPSRGRSSSWSTRRSAPCAGPGCRWSARSPPASRSSPRRTSRSTSQSRRRSAARRATTSSGCSGDSMQDAGILEGDYVVVQPGRRRRQRRDRRRPDRGRGDREALLPREGPGPPPAREQGLQADPHPRRQGARPGGRRLQEGLTMAALATPRAGRSPSGRSADRRAVAAVRAGRRRRSRTSILARLGGSASPRVAPSAPSAAARCRADGGCAACGSELR